MTDTSSVQPPFPDQQSVDFSQQFPDQQFEFAQVAPEPLQPSAEPLVQEQQAPSQPQNQTQQEQPYVQNPNINLNSNGPQPEYVVLTWQAPSRPFKKRNRQYYVTIALIVGLISAILLVAGQFLPIAVVISVGFLAYVLSAVPPETITNTITTYGIRTEDSLYYWEELGRFWLTDKYGQRIVSIESARFPFQITLVVNAEIEDDLVEVLSSMLLYERPIPTSFDKASKWMQEKIPLE